MTKNLDQCTSLASKAAAAGAKVLFLPEASDYIATSASESLGLAEPMASSPFVKGLQDAAKQHNLAIHVGIHDVAPNSSSSSSSSSSPTSQEQQPQKLYNGTIYISPDGTLLHPTGTYNKLHLFDYASLRESASTQAGSDFTPPFPSPIGLLGSLICFDLRFPEAALHLAKPPPPPPPPPPSSQSQTQEAAAAAAAQVLLYPSAFTVPTGQAHWEALLRARAIETQSWVVAAAQVGRHHAFEEGGKRVSYGHSMVVDPWGRVVVELKGVEDVNATHSVDIEAAVGGTGKGSNVGEQKQQQQEQRWEAVDGAVGELGVFEVDLDHVARVREQMPLVRRTDLYSSC
ncbi:carbon-nitrogen hydrolase [Microdochium trichocladiopsis]|uniref:Carbon-nitrogen hydrolase n=1 Tax=Microdochium trichocladiopsis TaxID=1682393 RepID=A0A9P9BI61_9PEZI|nr:carbon-nitrogen hydrolase [Microdochium trichocladiopsis]KAH7021250.1 carbon-nitrogen hydrolase [Microdochium trichocladiopsis]